MTTAAIIQARMGSTRLPGKVLLALGGAHVLACVIDRVRAATRLDTVVVATSDAASDDAVARAAEDLGCPAWRGSLDDVLGRFYGAAMYAEADVVVRITADCPLIDPQVIDAMLYEFVHGEYCDYLSNTMERTYPRGLDAEIFRLESLERANERAVQRYEREHVTPFLYRNPSLFRTRSYLDPSGADRSNLRWTLDTAEDHRFLCEVYGRIPHERPRDVTTRKVLELLELDPALPSINAGVRQKDLHE